MAYAMKNGFFGRDVSGSNNPMYKNGQKIVQAHKDGKYKDLYTKLPDIVAQESFILTIRGKTFVVIESTQFKVSNSIF